MAAGRGCFQCRRWVRCWLFTILPCAGLGVFVEQDLLGQLVSPQLHADRTVTFRLAAPQAKEVFVQGLAGLPPQAMVKSAGGNWEITLGPLAPELYSYTFAVDGATVTDPHNRHVKKWLSVENLLEVPGEPPMLHERQAVPHGVVHHHVYRSRTTNTERGVYVYTPPGYRGDAPSPRFPLLVLLHGYGDDESAWLEVGRAHWMADNLIAQQRAIPLVIAMPYGHPLPLEKQTTFEDYSARNRVVMEQDLMEDLLPLLQREYRVADDSRQRAIVGLSMGGGQSLMIGLKRLDQFAWVGGFSSAPPQDDLDRQFAALVQDVPLANRQLQLLWLACGQEDYLLDRNDQLHRWLEQHGIHHTYHITAGAHDWMVWRKYLAEFLPLLFRNT